MKTLTSNASTIAEWVTARAAETIGESGPVILAESELNHVAAAGGKKGVSGGSTNDPHPRPQ